MYVFPTFELEVGNVHEQMVNIIASHAHVLYDNLKRLVIISKL